MTISDRLQSTDHTPRHPELVSGPISTFSQTVIGAWWMLKLVQHDGASGRSVVYRGQSQIDREINPLRVFRFNQVNLPRALPVFQLLFSADRAAHIVKHLKSNETIHRVFRSVSGRQVIAVLVKTLDQVRGYAYVKRAIGLAREYVDGRVFLLSHRQYMGGQWTLKQVQGDEFGVFGRY